MLSVVCMTMQFIMFSLISFLLSFSVNLFHRLLRCSRARRKRVRHFKYFPLHNERKKHTATVVVMCFLLLLLWPASFRFISFLFLLRGALWHFKSFRFESKLWANRLKSSCLSSTILCSQAQDIIHFFVIFVILILSVKWMSNNEHSSLRCFEISSSELLHKSQIKA